MSEEPGSFDSLESPDVELANLRNALRELDRFAREIDRLQKRTAQLDQLLGEMYSE